MAVRNVCHDGSMAWVLDLDGVMWLGDRPIPGSSAAVARLRAAGEDVVFVTNNSWSPVAEVEARLAAMGVDAAGLVLTSAMAAARRVEPGEQALVCGGPGIVEALVSSGAVVVDRPPADVVVVGLARDLTYEVLARATLAVRAGARLLATNDDATYPTPAGELPGGGAILAAVVTATGAVPEVAGKPHAAMAELVRERTGDTVGMVVGDRPSTDGALAARLGAPFGLVRSGVDESAVGARGVEAPDLAALVERVLGGA